MLELDLPMATELFELLNVRRELTLDFMAVFARFEYALKQGGYVKGDERQVSPDWDHFAKDVSTLDAVILAPVLNSCKYLQEHPPKKQILRAGLLEWADRKGSSGPPIADVLLNVRTVRK
jgi:hypothetical protein